MQFKDVLKESKERKNLRGSGEIAKKRKTERKWRGNEETGGSTYRSNLKRYPGLHDFCLSNMSF